MTDDTDLDARITALDLEAKVRLLTGATMFTLQGDDSIGLGTMAFSDGPTGVRGLEFVGGDEVALMPNATLIASAWDEDLAHEVGQVLAEEAERQHIHVVLGPTINLHRSPLGGRLFEAYSEDPLLTGRLAAAYVKGLQGNGIGACLKHLVANESETERHTVNSVVDESTLRELYLLPFEIAVEDSHPWSIMAAYNDVNGVPATEQDAVNNGIVKGEWGWDGLLMSDWFATKSAAAAANGGLDLVMPGPDGPWGAALVAAVESGDVDESTIDDHLRRLLRLAGRVGALDGGRAWSTDCPPPTDPVRRQQLERLAARGMTVVRNDGSLPLDRATRVALIGRHATRTIDMGGGSAQVRPPHQISVAEALAARLADVDVVDGVEVRSRPVPADLDVVTDPQGGAAGIHFTATTADGVVVVDRHVDDATVSFGFDDGLPEVPAVIRLEAVVAGNGPREVGVVGVGAWTVRVDGVAHDVTLGLSSGDVGEALLTPPGWTTVVDSAGPVELVAERRSTGAPFGRLSVVARQAPRPASDVIADAAAAAAAAEVAVVVVGLTEEQETEAVDKTTLALPGRQDDLVAAVAAVASRTVVVVNAATPVLMPWFGEVDAVLVAGIPGQEGGHAVASALVGDIEPSGRLVTSYPAADGASPAWGVTPVDGAVEYAEGPFVGYRGHHAGRAPAPTLWFGHGLGYGAWDYSDVAVSSTEDAAVVVSATVTNTSDRTSREVVQVYLEPGDPTQPVRLVGWSAVEVDSGASATVDVRCDERMWRRWDATSGSWARLEGGGTVLVARGLGDVRARLPWR
ncbi:beta-glucosidase [Terrabacter sp. Root181]|uniref:beta-glucosidase family protein n=1 Tax=Terrabacter sp. Root181 TaxID=1736484 RepID=UPI0006F23187|nr:glycoside hydrolase family 3 C-terminal domain-containing protein [Terrabacter sp. Root181]KRB47525.1 glycosyl hydrolase [Terrabacter sp. Root181]